MDYEEIREYQSLSSRARELLRREEGLDVEFKQSLDALDVTDIVAFANSPQGGTILIGIKEVHRSSGRQKAIIHGERVGDRSKMHIVSKVNNIVPQLEVDIIVENLARKPFYRIEIPSGPNKPYCTTSGIYKIRDDGYSKPMMPSTMLSLLLEREADRFYQRFTKATEMLEDEILSIRNRALTELDQIEKHLKTISAKTDAILTDLGIEDPISTRRKQLLEKMTSILKDIGVSESGIKQFIDSIVK